MRICYPSPLFRDESFIASFSRRLDTGSSKAIANYANSLLFQNTFTLLACLHYFRLNSITAGSYRPTSLSLPENITDYELGKCCDLHSTLYTDPQFHNCLLFNSISPEHIFQKSNVTELMHRQKKFYYPHQSHFIVVSLH